MSPKDSPHSPSAMANQQYCLKWNNHQSNLLRAFDRLLQSESFTDVTLACEGRSLRAHKVVLSACSSYFECLFEEHPDKSPIVILKDMKFIHVSQLVNFMYRGEINITQDMLSGLLKTAETLKVKGLAEVSGEAGMAAGMAAASGATQTTPAISLPLVSPKAGIGRGWNGVSLPLTSTPQLMPPTSSPLTTALNAPSMPTMSPMNSMSPMTGISPMTSMSSPLTGPPLAPLAALLHNPGAMQHAFEERRVNLLKRMAGSDGDLSPSGTPDIVTNNSVDRPSTTHFLSQLNQDRSMAFTPKMPRRDDDTNSPVMLSGLPPALFVHNDPSKPPMQNVLTPIPHEITVNSQQELPDFLKPYTVFRLNDYLGFRTRQQFWEEPAVRRILEGIKNKEIDMKSAAELLGVSYGTLYGRYREVFGYLKHSWVNKPGRTPGSTNKERSIWEEARAQELIQRVLNKELSLTAAAVRLGVDTNTFFTHITDNGKNKALVALLLGKDNKENAQREMSMPNHSHSIDYSSMGVETIGIDCEPEHPVLMGSVDEDSNMGNSNMGSPAENSIHSLHSNENQNMMVTLEGQESTDNSQHAELNGEKDPLDVEDSTVGVEEQDSEHIETMDHSSNMIQETGPSLEHGPIIEHVEHIEEIEENEENNEQHQPPIETFQAQQQPPLAPIETFQAMENRAQQQPPLAPIETFQAQHQSPIVPIQTFQAMVEENRAQQQPPISQIETFQSMIDNPDPVGIHAES